MAQRRHCAVVVKASPVAEVAGASVTVRVDAFAEVLICLKPLLSLLL
jgi:hypothetical protein